MLRFKRKWNAVFFALLHLKAGKINAAAVDARRRTGFEAHEIETHAAQGIGQSECGEHAVRAAVIEHISDDDASL